MTVSLKTSNEKLVNIANFILCKTAETILRPCQSVVMK